MSSPAAGSHIVLYLFSLIVDLLRGIVAVAVRRRGGQAAGVVGTSARSRHQERPRPAADDPIHVAT